MIEARRLGKRYARGGADAPWALRDASFRIRRGESVAVIGNNGSGKSTLLKLLSRVIAPTEGSLAVEERPVGILELGAGFQPDLTGRENALAYGALLGFDARRSRAMLEEAAAFAGLERALDHPLKRYSTGMQMRLALAMATAARPGLLLLDEALSVGDIVFQQRCIDRLQSLRGQGATLLFVSHHLPLTRQLATRALWLDSGRLIQDGPAHQVIPAYVAFETSDGDPRSARPIGAELDGLRFLGIRVLDSSGRAPSLFDRGRELRIEVEYESSDPRPGLEIAVEAFSSATGMRLFALRRSSARGLGIAPGRWRCEIPLHASHFAPGTYHLDLAAYRPATGEDLRHPMAAVFHVAELGLAPEGSPVTTETAPQVAAPWAESFTCAAGLEPEAPPRAEAPASPRG